MTAPYRHKPLTFHLDGIDVTLNRLTDQLYDRLWRRSVAIAEDGRFMRMLEREASADGEDLNFAEIHFMLQHLFGRSGNDYDDWKGTFSFPFSLDVQRPDSTYPYLMNIHIHRTSLEFGLRRIVTDSALCDHVIRQPFPAEFSRQEINAFIAHFYGYLYGYLESLLKRKPRIRHFIRKIGSNLILYGYCNGSFYEEQFHDETAFDAAYNAWKPADRKS